MRGQCPSEWANYLKLHKIDDVSFAGFSLPRVSYDHIVLEGVDLRNSNFSSSNFPDSSFIRTNLSGASFCGARLCNTCFDYSNLTYTDFSRSDPMHTNMRYADLRYANFRNADLRFTNFEGSDLRGANFKNAVLREVCLENTKLDDAVFNGSVIVNSDFRGALGLENCIHNGPSSIDHLTIQNTGTLPTIFLRGCGLPEKLIEYYPSLLNQTISFYSCFISYSHGDKLFARRLHDQLQGRGIRCWLDEHQILPGDDIYAEVEKGLKLWDKVLLCASEISLNSWWVEREIDRAFKREMELTKKKDKSVLTIIPINLDGHLFEWDHAHASALQKRLASDFVGWETDNSKFEASFEGVVKALKAEGGAREKPPESLL